jgi:hypothetical protein
MKLHTEYNPVERFGVQNETVFTIKTTAKSFEILSSGIYTDNILAVVRELSSNACDAHIAAGKGDVPFEIHLPNSLEPWFHVKDWGTGLSDEDIQGKLVPAMVEDVDGELVQQLDTDGTPKFIRVGGLFTTYFDSTKTNSDDFIGFQGLGCKSPLSYTTAFEVISRFNGMRRIYSIFINEDGIPSVAKLGELATDEANGLEIKIAVKSSDFRKFIEKTASCLKWFPVKPVVVGEYGFTFDSIPSSLIERKNWRVIPRRYGDPQMSVVQGNIAYVVNLAQLGLDSVTEDVIKRNHLVTFFNIGELDIPASREEIKYTARSVKALKQRIREFEQEIIDRVEEKANECPESFWRTCINLDAWSVSNLGSRDALASFARGKKLNNAMLEKYYKQEGFVVLPDKLVGHEICKYVVPRYNTPNNNLTKQSVGTTIRPSESTLVFINDVRVGGVSRMSLYARDSGRSYIPEVLCIKRIRDAKRTEFVTSNEDGPNVIHHPLTEEDYNAEFKAIVQALGNPDLLYVSTATTKIQREKNSTLMVYQYSRCKRKNWRNETVEWEQLEADEFDFDKGGLYFNLRNGSKIMSSVTRGPIPIDWEARYVRESLLTIISLINEQFGTTYEFKDVYAVGSRSLNKFKTNKKWLNIFDLFMQVIPHYADHVRFIQQLGATPRDLDVKSLIGNEKFVNGVKALEQNSTFRRLVEPMIDSYNKYVAPTAATNSRYGVGFIQSFDRLYGNKIFSYQDITPFFGGGDFSRHYPMLAFVDSINISDDYNNQKINTLFDYIKTVDRSKN